MTAFETIKGLKLAVSCAGLAALAALAPGAIDNSRAAESSSPPHDVSGGRSVAVERCAPCHDFDGTGMSRNLSSSVSLREIANQPSMSAARLEQFLSSTSANVRHPSAMPTPGLSREQINMLARFVMSLRDTD